MYDKYKKPFNARADNAEPVLMRGIEECDHKVWAYTGTACIKERNTF